jgi:hypothetical protein
MEEEVDFLAQTLRKMSDEAEEGDFLSQTLQKLRGRRREASQRKRCAR